MKKFFAAVLIAFSPIFLTSCGDDEPEYVAPAVPEAGSNTSGNDDPASSDTQIKALIRKHVTVRAAYSDYMWNFTITSTLHNALPDATIKFGIGHGDIDGETQISVGSQAYGYTSRYNGDNFEAKFVNPFWFYYIFGVDPSDGESATLCSMYYNSYNALKSQGYGNLSPEEKSLYNDLVRYLDEYERTADMYYSPSVYVQVNNKVYMFASYGK
ncbi:MAG: hypothetical protein K1V76_01895 [Candidatus Amulumruptor sp.]